MSKKHSISLLSAVFININIIAGAGLFINTVILTKLTGTIGSISYLLVGAFLAPLVYTFAELLKDHPSGGLYSFARPLSPFWGFVACWSYFFAKLASASLVIYVSSIFLQQLIPALGIIPPLGLSCIILALFVYLNMFNVHVGNAIQKVFLFAKTVPILSIIMIGIYKLNHAATFTVQPENLSNLPSSIPLVIYCLAGFEAACAISRKLKNPQEDGPKAIFYSFFIVLATYTVFQFLLSNMILPNIDNMSTYRDVFPYIVSLLPISAYAQEQFAHIISGFVGITALGGAYGMLFSNIWNLYTLAEHKHTFMPEKLTKLNSQHMPTVAILLEGLVCLLFLLITQGDQIPLQQISAFGGVIAYILSAISLLHTKPSKMAYLALLSSIGMFVFCIISFVNLSLTALALFSGMFGFGCFMYFASKK